MRSSYLEVSLTADEDDGLTTRGGRQTKVAFTADAIPWTVPCGTYYGDNDNVRCAARTRGSAAGV